jgi:8-oxo-dGTP diphosphatase
MTDDAGVSNSSVRKCVGALLISGNRALLAHRHANRSWYPNVWDLPGGHIEPSETPSYALVRELREELGIEIAHPREPPLQIVADAQMHLSIWIVSTWTGTPSNLAPDEHDELRWIALHEINSLALAHPSYPELLRKALPAARYT